MLPKQHLKSEKAIEFILMFHDLKFCRLLKGGSYGKVNALS
jgi:hypothetical protein